jgi:hypothetical protein
MRVIRGVFATVETLEEDDVPAQGFLEVLGELVDQDPIPHLQRRNHAL